MANALSAVKTCVRLSWLASRRVAAHRGPIVAGHMAFTGFVALFPFLIFLAAVASMAGPFANADGVIASLFRFLPEDVARTLSPVVRDVLSERRGGLLTAGLGGSVWAASGGIEAFREALNRAYGVREQRSLWRRRLQSVLFVIGGGAAFLVLMVAIVLGPALWRLADTLVGLPPDSRLLWDGARYLSGVSVLLAVLFTLHHYLPNHGWSFRRVVPGVLVTALLWLAGATLFSFYLANFADYSITYGSLGGIVATLLFFHLSSLLFVFGAELNAAIASTTDDAAAGRNETAPSTVVLTCAMLDATARE